MQSPGRLKCAGGGILSAGIARPPFGLLDRCRPDCSTDAVRIARQMPPGLFVPDRSTATIRIALFLPGSHCLRPDRVTRSRLTLSRPLDFLPSGHSPVRSLTRPVTHSRLDHSLRQNPLPGSSVTAPDCSFPSGQLLSSPPGPFRIAPRQPGTHPRPAPLGLCYPTPSDYLPIPSGLCCPAPPRTGSV